MLSKYCTAPFFNNFAKWIATINAIFFLQNHKIKYMLPWSSHPYGLYWLCKGDNQRKCECKTINNTEYFIIIFFWPIESVKHVHAVIILQIKSSKSFKRFLWLRQKSFTEFTVILENIIAICIHFLSVELDKTKNIMLIFLITIKIRKSLQPNTHIIPIYSNKL